jgi:hypothetical protein
MKFRWTREELQKRSQRLARVKLCPPAEEGFIRTAEQRLSERRAAAQNLQALVRPLKPPARRET